MFLLYARRNTGNCELTASLLTAMIWATKRPTTATYILRGYSLIRPFNRWLTTARVHLSWKWGWVGHSNPMTHTSWHQCLSGELMSLLLPESFLQASTNYWVNSPDFILCNPKEISCLEHLKIWAWMRRRNHLASGSRCHQFAVSELLIVIVIVIIIIIIIITTTTTIILLLL